MAMSTEEALASLQNKPMSTEEALASIKPMSTEEALASVQEDTSTLDNIQGAGESLLRGIFFGGQDEFAGATRALFDRILPDPGAEFVTGEDFTDNTQTPGESFQMYGKEAREHQREFAEDNYWTALGLEIAGGLVTGGASFAAAKAMAPAAGAVGRSALTGGLDAATYGFLDEEGPAGGRLINAAKYGFGGIALGGAISKGASKLAERGVRKAESNANDLINEMNDAVVIARSQGMEPAEAIASAQIAVRTTPEAVAEAATISGRKVGIPSVAKAAEDAGAVIAAKVNGTNSPSSFIGRMGELGKEGVEKIGGVISTRIKNVSPALHSRLRKLEMVIHTDGEQYVKRIKAFEELRKLPQGTQRAVAKALFNGRTGDAVAAAPQMKKVILEAGKVVRELGAKLKSVGYDYDDIPNYFPRMVKDYKGLVKTLGRDDFSEFQAHLAKAAKRTPNGKLSNIQKENAINNFFEKRSPFGDGKIGNVKERTIGYVSDEMLPHYADPVESLTTYIHRAVGDVEMKKFFNKSAAGGNLRKLIKNRSESIELLDDADIQKSVDRLVMTEKLDGIDAATVKAVLNSRFGPGRRGMSEGWKTLKDTSSLGALGSFTSAITQLGDTANSVLLNGVLPTIRAAVRSLKNKNIIELDEVGMDNMLSQDLQSHANWIGKLFDAVLNFTQFKRFDRFGKRTLLNGAIIKAAGQVRTQKGMAKLRRKWEPIFGDQMDDLIQDLKNGDKTENVKFLAFNTLSDAQPVSLSEMPQMYLDHPNGRIIYTLKTYAVKQLDVLRNQVWNKAKTRGERAEGLLNMGKFMFFVGLMNGTIMEMKGLVRGDEIKPEDIPDNAVDALMSISILGNRYALENYWRKGDVKGAVANTVLPPIPTEIRNIPIAGQIIDDWFLGGKERREKYERLRGN